MGEMNGDSSVSLFLKNGFSEECRTREIIMLRKDLRELHTVYGALDPVWDIFRRQFLRNCAEITCELQWRKTEDNTVDRLYISQVILKQFLRKGEDKLWTGFK